MKWLSDLFDDARQNWAMAAGALSPYLLYKAFALNRWTIAGWPRPTVIGALAGMVFAIAFFAKQNSWGRWFGLLFTGCLALAAIIDGALAGWTFSHIGWAAFFLFWAGAFYWEFFSTPEAGESDDEKKPLISLVLLLREPRFVDAAIVASIASKAWEMPVNAASENGSDEASDGLAESESPRAFVVGESPIFIANHPAGMFLVHNHERTYFDDVDSAADEIGEMRAQKAVRDHQAWMAVDLLHWHGEDGGDLGVAYCLIARMLAELADDNVLAVIDTAGAQVFPYDPELEKKLRSDDPRAQLRDWHYAPILSVDPDDPRMLAAVAEAEARWPEFVSAFEQRSAGSDGPWLVKAPFGPEGAQEFMWVTVTALENERIYGILENDASGFAEPKAGDRVVVATSDVSDWLCEMGGQPTGGFSLKVLADSARRGDVPDSERS